VIFTLKPVNTFDKKIFILYSTMAHCKKIIYEIVGDLN
jgi:hypothetical protein